MASITFRMCRAWIRTFQTAPPRTRVAAGSRSNKSIIAPSRCSVFMKRYLFVHFTSEMILIQPLRCTFRLGLSVHALKNRPQSSDSYFGTGRAPEFQTGVDLLATPTRKVAWRTLGECGKRSDQVVRRAMLPKSVLPAGVQGRKEGALMAARPAGSSPKRNLLGVDDLAGPFDRPGRPRTAGYSARRPALPFDPGAG